MQGKTPLVQVKEPCVVCLYDSSDVKTYIYVRWLGPDDLAVARPTGV